MKNYKNAIEKIRNLPPCLPKIEDDSIYTTIYNQRNYWKPEGRIKLLLLAESHMYTSKEDHNITVVNEDYVFPKGSNQYTKFIYCLGHGEPELLSSPPEIIGRTPQFWKIFYGLFHDLSLEKNTQNIPILKTHTLDLNTRLTEKVKLLQRMKDNGIWLLDASPVAIAGNTPCTRRCYYRAMLKISAKEYLKPLIDDMQPERVLIIGKEVEKAIQPILNLRDSFTIPQPTAFLRAEAKTKLFSDVYKIGQEAMKHAK
jgi:hypothetical protein